MKQTLLLNQTFSESNLHQNNNYKCMQRAITNRASAQFSQISLGKFHPRVRWAKTKRMEWTCLLDGMLFSAMFTYFSFLFVHIPIHQNKELWTLYNFYNKQHYKIYNSDLFSSNFKRWSMLPFQNKYIHVLNFLL